MTENLMHLIVITFAPRPDKGLKWSKIINRNFDGVLLKRDRVKCIPQFFTNLSQKIMLSNLPQFLRTYAYHERCKGLHVQNSILGRKRVLLELYTNRTNSNISDSKIPQARVLIVDLWAPRRQE